ncbi:hypothetical protein P2318_04855 [Myxococcaceae bacterium GXIMD 01537]
MRSWVLASLAVGLLAGCAARQSSLGIPNEEALYAQPLEEMWPEVRTFFTANQLPFREDPGSFVLETDWRSEFGASQISGYWHRYMVLGKRETPTTSKLWIIRVTRSNNSALKHPGTNLDWGVSKTLGGGASAPGSEIVSPETMWEAESVEDVADMMSEFRGDNGIMAKTAQGSRDLVMEWRVFKAISPALEEKAQAVRARQEARDAQLAAASVRSVPAKPSPAMAVECGMPIIGLAPRARAGSVLLMGELHGTQEVPRFVAQSACQSAQAGTPVTVGLELPVENQERIERFLASAGTEADWRALMDAPFWRSPFPDGRGSEAVANLLEQLRGLRASGMDVRAFAFDHPEARGQAREDAMAKAVLSRVKAGPERFYMVVSGNVHPRTKKGLPWDREYRPMGLLLSEALDSDDVVALDMAYDSGSAWICAADPKAANGRLECGVRTAKGRDNGDRPFIHLFKSRTDDGFHGVFYVGKVSASVPAVNRGVGRPGSNDNTLQGREDAVPALARLR